MKQMKNIKTPAYELKLGKGFFAGTNWQCIKCGYIAKNYSTNPIINGCKVTGGNHIFQQM
ncbi:MAG: hypothetical protein PUE59_06650 [Treponema sp.]|nr:hypothetical protein [Treponema sp.]